MPIDATLAILAGGKGSRLGRPKAELRIDGLPILQWLLKRLNWPGPTMLVTSPSRQHPPGWKLFVQECCDPQDDLGPLRGLLTVLENLSTPLAVVTTVDMPLMGTTQLSWCLDQLQADPQALGIMASRMDSGRVLIEPFPSAYRKQAIDQVMAQMHSEARSVHSLSCRQGFAVRPAPADWPTETWLNLNYPEDLNRLAELGIGSAGF